MFVKDAFPSWCWITDIFTNFNATYVIDLRRVKAKLTNCELTLVTMRSNISFPPWDALEPPDHYIPSYYHHDLIAYYWNNILIYKNIVWLCIFLDHKNSKITRAQSLKVPHTTDLNCWGCFLKRTCKYFLYSKLVEVEVKSAIVLCII